MICIKILGGLGNQMFQYAAGLAASKRSGVNLVLDISSFDNYKLHHGFILDKVFDIQPTIANKKQVSFLAGSRYMIYLRKILSLYGIEMFSPKTYIREDLLRELSDISSPCYMDGYWQSLNYFSGFESEIKNAFQFKSFLSDENPDLRKIEQIDNSVSIHIRRGDYISDSKTSKIMSVCTDSYYQSAIDCIESTVKNPVFFIFSDDPAYCRNLKFLRGKDIHFVDSYNGPNDYYDMKLMTLCKHHIISNSTFSWWGAWLSNSSGAITIAPSQWFVDAAIPKGLYPTFWKVI